MLEKIPVISEEDLRSDECSTRIQQAFEEIGFVLIKTGYVTSLLPRTYHEFKQVFNLPVEVKAKYARPDLGHQRGWTPPFSEMGLACRKMGRDGKGLADSKENWFMGPDLRRIDPNILARYPFAFAENVWPSEAPGFKSVMQQLYATLQAYGMKVLELLQPGYRSPEYWRDLVTDAPTVLRAIHYPPVSAEEVGNIVWGCMHTDINLVTVLPASTKPGLWIRRRDGVWIPGNTPEAEGCIFVQVGDMLDYLTGGRFMSAAHEVRAPEAPTTEGRLSAALFIHARPNAVFDPDLSTADKVFYPRTTAYELLEERLKAIQLVK